MNEYYCINLDTTTLHFLGYHDSFDEADEAAGRQGLLHVWIIGREDVAGLIKTGIDAMIQDASKVNQAMAGKREILDNFWEALGGRS